jgi:hypothetical protein
VGRLLASTVSWVQPQVAPALTVLTGAAQKVIGTEALGSWRNITNWSPMTKLVLSMWTAMGVVPLRRVQTMVDRSRQSSDRAVVVLEKL